MNSVSPAIITNNVGMTLVAAVFNLVITLVLRMFCGCMLSGVRTLADRVRSSSVSLLSVMVGCGLGCGGWSRVDGLSCGLSCCMLCTVFTLVLIMLNLFCFKKSTRKATTLTNISPRV